MTKSKHILLAGVLGLATMFSMSAYADKENDGVTCNGNGSCGQSTTNNYNTTTSNQGGVGIGGTGVGYGGVAYSVGGGANVQTGAVRNDNANTNANVNANTAQGGHATIQEGAVRNTNNNFNAQDQSQSQSIRNSGNSSSVSVGIGGEGGKGGAGGIGLGGAASATGGSVSNSGNSSASASNNSNGNVVNIAAPKTYRPPVNSAFAPTIFPTAPCMGSSSVGGSGTLFSFSGGTSWESKECMLLETARSFDQAGFRDDALHIRCQGKYAKEAPSCKALANGTKPAVAATPATSAEVNRATEQQLEVVTTETATVTQVANPVGQ